MFLTADEIVELTGKVKPSAQARMLGRLGVAFKLRPGRVLVLKSEVERALSGGHEQKSGIRWDKVL